MYNDEILFEEIKREVLPDGRIRYYAEKIVEEVEIDAPGSRSEIDERFSHLAEPMRKDIIKTLALSNPYINLFQGS